VTMFKITDGDVPPGQYEVEFLGDKETQHPQWGPGRIWPFRVLGGPYAGLTVSRTTKPMPKPGTIGGRMLTALAGREIGAGEEIDSAAFVGRRYLAIVETAPGGRTRVASVVPCQEAMPNTALAPLVGGGSGPQTPAIAPSPWARAAGTTTESAPASPPAAGLGGGLNSASILWPVAASAAVLGPTAAAPPPPGVGRPVGP